MKRIIIATLSGLLFGFVCYTMASSSGSLPTPVAWQIVVSRTLIGFAIGLCGFKMKHWAFRGLVLGFIFSLPLGISGLMGPDNPEFSNCMILISTIIMGAVYGVLIEVITTVLFKARIYS